VLTRFPNLRYLHIAGKHAPEQHLLKELFLTLKSSINLQHLEFTFRNQPIYRQLDLGKEFGGFLQESNIQTLSLEGIFEDVEVWGSYIFPNAQSLRALKFNYTITSLIVYILSRIEMTQIESMVIPAVGPDICPFICVGPWTRLEKYTLRMASFTDSFFSFQHEDSKFKGLCVSVDAIEAPEIKYLADFFTHINENYPNLEGLFFTIRQSIAPSLTKSVETTLINVVPYMIELLNKLHFVILPMCCWKLLNRFHKHVRNPNLLSISCPMESLAETPIIFKLRGDMCRPNLTRAILESRTSEPLPIKCAYAVADFVGYEPDFLQNSLNARASFPLVV